MMDLDLGWRCVFAGGMSAWFEGGGVALTGKGGPVTTLDED
jgi:hypothetical protein